MLRVELGEIEIINAREIWKHEEKEFTPWIAENIDKISELIGVPITIEQTEQRVGNYELDIYGKVEGKESVVIIENQLNITDHSHLGQLIAYAGGLEASIIIWIATEFRDEHRTAIEWLNRIVSDKVSFFLIRPEVVKIGDSKPAVRFYLENGPSDFERRFREILDTGDAPRHEFRIKFWDDLLRFLENDGHKWAKGRRTTKDSWISSAIGKAGIRVSVSMAKNSRIRVEIYFDNDADKKMYEKLFSHKEKIEKLIPNEKLSWERLDEARASRFAVYRDYDKIQSEQAGSYKDDLFKWISNRLFDLRGIAEKIFVKSESL